MAITNTLIQTMVPEEKRARAMSYYTMAFFASMPFGSLIAGFVAQQIGAPSTVLLTGACCMGASVWFAFELPKIREALAPT
jgi:predicted MFS family arabinose efflux permease